MLCRVISTASPQSGPGVLGSGVYLQDTQVNPQHAYTLARPAAKRVSHAAILTLKDVEGTDFRKASGTVPLQSRSKF